MAQNIDNQLLGGTMVEYEMTGGFCYQWCMYSTISCGLMTPCICCPYQFMKTQSVNLDDSRIHYKADCWLYNQDKLVPYDRIQDININENCMERCCCIAEIQIQTAGGGNIPEITIIAPKNPIDLRDRILNARDEFVRREKTIQHLQPTNNDTCQHASEEEIGLLMKTLNRMESKLATTVDSQL